MRATTVRVMLFSFNYSVIIAVSFNVTPGSDYTSSSSKMVEMIYNHLAQLRTDYNVINMKLGIIS